MENIHRALVLKHLTHNADGTECPTAAASIPMFVREKLNIQNFNVIQEEFKKKDKADNKGSQRAEVFFDAVKAFSQ